MSFEESREIMSALKQHPPAIRIVFVTPEKVARSDALMRLFDSLHAQNTFVRAHPPLQPSSFPLVMTLQDYKVKLLKLGACLQTIRLSVQKNSFDDSMRR